MTKLQTIIIFGMVIVNLAYILYNIRNAKRNRQMEIQRILIGNNLMSLMKQMNEFEEKRQEYFKEVNKRKGNE